MRWWVGIASVLTATAAGAATVLMLPVQAGAGLGDDE